MEPYPPAPQSLSTRLGARVRRGDQPRESLGQVSWSGQGSGEPGQVWHRQDCHIAIFPVYSIKDIFYILYVHPIEPYPDMKHSPFRTYISLGHL